MRWSSQLLVAIALLVMAEGCDQASPAKHEKVRAPTPMTAPSADSSRTQTGYDSLAILAAAADTFRLGSGRVFRLEVITERQYAQAGATGRERKFPADSAAAVAAEAAYLQASAGHAWRRADTLFFKTEQGKIIRLQDGPTHHQDEDSYEGYRYLDDLSVIQQWLVEVGKWEGGYYILIDQRTGKRTNLIGYPVISPDQTQFICANSSPTGYDWNGLQLWAKPKGLPPQLRWQRLSDGSNPGIAALIPRWENAKTVLFQEDFLIATRYVRIHI